MNTLGEFSAQQLLVPATDLASSVQVPAEANHPSSPTPPTRSYVVWPASCTAVTERLHTGLRAHGPDLLARLEYHRSHWLPLGSLPWRSRVCAVRWCVSSGFQQELGLTVLRQVDLCSTRIPVLPGLSTSGRSLAASVQV